MTNAADFYREWNPKADTAECSSLNPIIRMMEAFAEKREIEAFDRLLEVNKNGVNGDGFHRIEMIDGGFQWCRDHHDEYLMDGEKLLNILGANLVSKVKKIEESKTRQKNQAKW